MRLVGDRRRRGDAGGVTGVDPGLLDMLHDPAEQQLGAVEHGIDVDLDRGLEEAVDQHRRPGQLGVGLPYISRT